MRAWVIRGAFALLLVVHVGVLLADPQFGPNDDYYLLDTVQRGKWLPFTTFMGGGRFYPLNGWEYNLVAQILPPTPGFYYLFNAVELVLFALVFYLLLRRVNGSRALCFALVALAITTYGFFQAWFRLLVPERGEIFWFAVFLLAYLHFLDRPRWLVGVVALVAANLALYHKEPGFLMLGGFGLGHLLLGWKASPVRVRVLDGLLVLSAAIYGTVYFALAGRGGANYAEIRGAQSLDQTFGYFLTWEPLLPLCLIPAVLLRAYQLLAAKRPLHPLYDPLLGAALVYVAVFFYLGITAQYYLLPTYVFALPAWLFYLDELRRIKASPLLPVGVAMGVGAAVYFAFADPANRFASIFPNSLAQINRLRYVPINYNLALDYLVQDIRRHPNRRANIYLNTNRNSGFEAYLSFARFLKSRGLSERQFDLRSDAPADSRYNLSVVDPYSPYSVFRSPQATALTSGDYLVLLPTAFYGPLVEFRKDALLADDDGPCDGRTTQDYRLLFRTGSPRTFPWNPWDLQAVWRWLRGEPQPWLNHCKRDLNYYVLMRR
ncbi:hypothetical protein [Gloeobacter morelensis]|uniref:Glycosyltransferase RgtA/B/C/D-like domain-containing protein n=1 Tax=Gloeobacter morelensis MG652769 TaxID=2781736 RepID=A0ABY3PIE7_9CYAN|nr:hypothetical protein [Gloeobacter morelensis]UFP93425.1 hypothetical protein ISF26_16710 [Gloeobacter morelensis MG652769]